MQDSQYEIDENRRSDPRRRRPVASQAEPSEDGSEDDHGELGVADADMNALFGIADTPPSFEPMRIFQLWIDD